MQYENQEIILFESKHNGVPFKVQATIIEGAVNFKFSDAKICKEFYYQERLKNPNLKFFERLMSFTEFYPNLMKEEIKQKLLDQMKNLGMKDYTTKMAKKVKEKLKENGN